MNYTFDAVKNRWILALVVSFIMLLPLIPFIVMNVRAWFPIPPNIYISLGIPILIGVSASLLIAQNKRYLFWTKMDLSIDEKNSNLEINQQKFSFHDLQYFAYRQGTYLTTGIKRPVLFLKFKSEKVKVIIPCRSSKGIEHYDRFIQEFDRIKTEKKFKARVIIK